MKKTYPSIFSKIKPLFQSLRGLLLLTNLVDINLIIDVEEKQTGTFNAGVSTLPHTYVSGGTVNAGITTSVSCADNAPLDKSIANVCDITT